MSLTSQYIHYLEISTSALGEMNKNLFSSRIVLPWGIMLQPEKMYQGVSSQWAAHKAEGPQDFGSYLRGFLQIVSPSDVVSTHSH